MSNYIYAMHGECPKDVLTNGWVVTTHELGHDPTHTSGHDYSDWSDYGVIARLNNGYYPNGTIPEKTHYHDFAVRVANFVAASVGCHHWIIGNEPNMMIERPNDIPILPEEYALCYSMCRNAIKILPGHEDDLVLIAAIAPWNVQSGYWIWYFQKVLAETPYVDGITLHTYTHGNDPALIFSEQKMDAPYDSNYYHFFAYKDFMWEIPERLKDVPVFITETNQNDPWLDENNGWIQNAYQEINSWNQENEQKIRCLALYRWQGDQWYVKDKNNVIAGFLETQAFDYKWTDETPPDPPNGGDMEEILNDGFENGFYNYEGVGELECPTGWKPQWDDDPREGVLDRPEYKPAGTAQVRNGIGAAAIHSRYQTIDGVLLRSVVVASGEQVKASVWMLKVAEEGGHGMQIGIHPHGGENFLDDSVVWSNWYSQYEDDYENNKWRERSVQIQAQANQITVFLRSKVDAAVDGSNAHFDDLVVEAENGVTPPDPPEPGEGLQYYIDVIRADIAQLEADVDAMESYIQNGSILALPIS